MSRLARLANEISEIRGAVKSAVTLIDSLTKRIEDCECDPEKLDELIKELKTERERLASAIIENDEEEDGYDEEDESDEDDYDEEDEEDEEDDELFNENITV